MSSEYRLHLVLVTQGLDEVIQSNGYNHGVGYCRVRDCRLLVYCYPCHNVIEDRRPLSIGVPLLRPRAYSLGALNPSESNAMWPN